VREDLGVVHRHRRGFGEQLPQLGGVLIEDVFAVGLARGPFQPRLHALSWRADIPAVWASCRWEDCQLARLGSDGSPK
jgi:hypothetical protein